MIPTAEEILAGPIKTEISKVTVIGPSKEDLLAENSLIEAESEYLTADEMHEQLMSQGKTSTNDILQKMYQLDQVIQALTARKGKLNSAVDYVPVKDEDVIRHINGGTIPDSRFVVYKDARVCLVKDIPHIKAMDELTTVDMNHPKDTGKLAAAKAL